jgi:hypothetical protein
MSRTGLKVYEYNSLIAEENLAISSVIRCKKEKF